MEVPRPASTKVPTFSGSNWKTWYLRFTTWAKVQGLWPYIEGTVPRPPEIDPTSAGAISDLQSALQRLQLHDMRVVRAFEALVAAMEKPDHLRLLSEFQGRNGQPPCPDLAWKRLKAAHVVTQQTTYLQVSREMADLRMAKGETISNSGPGPRTSRSGALRQRCPCPPLLTSRLSSTLFPTPGLL